MNIYFDKENDEKIKFLMKLFASIIGIGGIITWIVVPDKLLSPAIIFFMFLLWVYEVIARCIMRKKYEFENILRMISDGQDYKEIANKLNVPEKFVKEVIKKNREGK